MAVTLLQGAIIGGTASWLSGNIRQTADERSPHVWGRVALAANHFFLVLAAVLQQTGGGHPLLALTAKIVLVLTPIVMWRGLARRDLVSVREGRQANFGGQFYFAAIVTSSVSLVLLGNVGGGLFSLAMLGWGNGYLSGGAAILGGLGYAGWVLAQGSIVMKIALLAAGIFGFMTTFSRPEPENAPVVAAAGGALDPRDPPPQGPPPPPYQPPRPPSPPPPYQPQQSLQGGETAGAPSAAALESRQQPTPSAPPAADTRIMEPRVAASLAQAAYQPYEPVHRVSSSLHDAIDRLNRRPLEQYANSQLGSQSRAPYFGPSSSAISAIPSGGPSWYGQLSYQPPTVRIAPSTSSSGMSWFSAFSPRPPVT